MFSRASRVLTDTLYAFRFYYQAHPRLFILLAIIFAVQAAVPALTLTFEKTAVDGFLTGSITAGALAIAGFLLTRLVGTLADEYGKLLQSTLTDLTNRRTSSMVAGLLESIPTLEIYHDVRYHDSVETLNSLGSKLSGAVLGVSAGSVALIKFVSLALILAAVNPWAPVVLAFCLIPHALMERRLTKAQFNGIVSLASDRRKIDYVGGLLFDPMLAKEMKLFGLAEHVFSLYRTLFDSAFKSQASLHRKQALLSAAGSLIVLSGVGVAIAATIAAYRDGVLSPGNLVMAFGAVESMSAYSGVIVGHMGRALQNSAYMGRLREMVSTAGEASRDHGPLPLDSTIEIIEAHDLQFAYPGSTRRVLDGVNLALRKGETVALVGLNGAGKTTLAKVLLGLYRPSGGLVSVNGTSIDDFDVTSLRSRMSCLFQDFVKYKLTVRDNVSFGGPGPGRHAITEPGDDELIEAIAKSGAECLVAAAGGLDAKLGKEFGGTDLSGGEWQKLALARTLVRNADFLILDEPSSALDAEAEYSLYSKFKEMSRNRICLLISHRFTTVRIADRILVLSDGRVIEEGSHDELMDRDGEYARMYLLQAEQYTDEDDPEPQEDKPS